MHQAKTYFPMYVGVTRLGSFLSPTGTCAPIGKPLQ